jgi:nickel-dependent lactate racemase
MKTESGKAIPAADLTRWKTVEVEYGSQVLPIRVPPDCRVIQMDEVPPAADPCEAIRRSIHHPIGGKPLPEILRDKGKPAGEVTVCVAVSDVTRPVPYKGETGLLPPLLSLLLQAGVVKGNITLLVGTGTHRPSTPAEKTGMFGEDVVAQCRIVDHECDNDAMLVDIGKTTSGTAVRVNRLFVEADVRIATALVGSHFMAGASGGRKAAGNALPERVLCEAIGDSGH